MRCFLRHIRVENFSYLRQKGKRRSEAVFYSSWRQYLAPSLPVFGAALVPTRNPLCLIVNAGIKFSISLRIRIILFVVRRFIRKN